MWWNALVVVILIATVIVAAAPWWRPRLRVRSEDALWDMIDRLDRWIDGIDARRGGRR
jgi:hypothetical protein